MRLRDLATLLKPRQIVGELGDGPVGRVVGDSRQAAPGAVFFALPGTQADGHLFAAQAVARGAVAVVVQRVVEGLKVAQLVVDDTRAALAVAAHEFYGRPSEAMTLVGVTGTNGKTTVSFLVEALLGAQGPTGLIGTVCWRWAGRQLRAQLTTPDAVELNRMLGQMQAEGVKGVVMEVSSHALDQRRADALAFDAGVFTNLSRDHLDYHQTLEAYFAAKARLFTELLAPGTLGVICTDQPWGQRLASMARARGIKVISFGLTQGTLMPRELECTLEGTRVVTSWGGSELEITSALLGRHNALNLLAAASVGLGLGMEPEEVARALGQVRVVPGRLERVWGPKWAPVVLVDYAHTPDALAVTLGAVRELTEGRIFCVFGAGGNRDQGKRPLMGQAVAQAADVAVLTSDNPRDEDPLAIMAMVEQGLQEGGMRRVHTQQELARGRKVYMAVAERGEAITMAIEAAGIQDVVVIAGKGHEDYQIVAGRRKPFDDRLRALEALMDRAASRTNGY